MDKEEKKLYLIDRLKNEEQHYREIMIPEDETEQRRLLRSLMNIRHPKEIEKEFLLIQDEYLKQELKDIGITLLTDLKPISQDFYLWQGDITTLQLLIVQ